METAPYEQMLGIMKDAEVDLHKYRSGNKAAGTRLRNKMQQIKKLAQELRETVLAETATTEERN